MAPTDFALSLSTDCKNYVSQASQQGVKLCEDSSDLGDSKVKHSERNWQLNIVVKFEDNPADVVTFKEDSKSKRMVVSEAQEGLELLKGFPILSVDDHDVNGLVSQEFEEMWKKQIPPFVVKFGNEPIVMVSPVKNTVSNSPKSFEDHVVFLGRTSTVAYDEVDKKINDEFKSRVDLHVLNEGLQLDAEIADLQPLSFNGTLGDKSGWSKKCQERAEIITELLNSEKIYIKGLEELHKWFLEPFAESLKKTAHVDVDSYHAKIQTLVHLHDKIYDKFHCAENICTVFQQEFAFLKMYKPCIKDFNETYRKLRESEKKRGFKQIFKNGLGMISRDPLGWFQTRSITIVQRPPRYILLLLELKKQTPVEHPMYSDLVKGLAAIEGTCDDINKYLQQLDSASKLLELADEIDSKTLREHGIEQLVVPARRLIRLGEVAIRKIRSSRTNLIRRSADEKVYFELGGLVMCNDILIIISGKKNRVVRVFKLPEIEAELNMEPIKPCNKYQSFEQLYEVILQKRSATQLEQMHSMRQLERMSLQTHGKSDSGRSIRLSRSSLVIWDDKEFSIYLSTLEEAEAWEASILKYSGL